MAHVLRSSPSAGLRGPPPADRPAGHRGIRGWVAGLAAVGAIPTLFLSTRPTGGAGGGGGSGTGFTYTFTLGSPTLGTELALTAMTLLLVAASAILWRARAPALVAGAGLLTAGVLAATVLLVGHANDHARPTPAAVNAVAIGSSRTAVLRQLGRPLAQARTTPSGSRPAPSCLIYAVDDRGAPVERPGTTAPIRLPSALRYEITAINDDAALCFVHDRLTAKLPA
jgi:hypothetical protein